MRRVLGALGVSLLLGLTLVFATTNEAQAFDQGSVQIITTEAGTAVATGGAVSACVASGVCEALAITGGVAVATGVAVYGVPRLFHWVFGSGHTVEEATVVSPTTSTQAGGGCWDYLNGVSQTTSPCAKPYDGYGPFGPYGGSNPTTYTSIVVTGALAQAATTGNVTASITITLGGSAPPTGRIKAQLACVDGSVASAQDLRAVGTWTASSTFTVPASVAASGCVAHGGANAFRVDDTLGPGCCGTVAGYALPTVAPGYEVPAPQHKWRTVKICHGGAGDTTLTEYSALFREADTTLPVLPNPVCPSGTLATSYTVYEGDATGAGSTQILTWTAPSTWANPSTSSYGDCLPGGSAAPCTVVLLKATPQGLLDCQGGRVDCTGFNADTALDTDYQCRWGPHAVPLTNCRQLALTAPGSTSTQTDTTPADPENSPLTPGQSNGECFPSGWAAFNPVEWVLKPVKCALTWAFVPNPATLSTQIDGVRTAVAGSSLGAAYQPVSEISAAWSQIASGQSGGCDGPGFTLVVPGKTMDLHPLTACASPMSTLATVTKASCAIGLMIGTVLLVVRILAGAFGVSVGALGRGGEDA